MVGPGDRLRGAIPHLCTTACSSSSRAYVFTNSRSGDTPVEMLGETKGKLVADAYSGYNKALALTAHLVFGAVLGAFYRVVPG